jgi:HNH endonuclease
MTQSMGTARSMTARTDLETLLQRLLLGDSSAFGDSPTEAELGFALDRATELLEAKGEYLDSTIFQLRLRLAMHLAPANAIAYSGANPTPRFQLIYDYLQEAFGRKGESVLRLARDIAKVLTSWDEQRDPLAGVMSVLLEKQGNRCANCRVAFGQPSKVWTVLHRDEYKPFFLSPEELLSPEVDHIDAVSCLGTNDLTNLQVLCRLCNAGKGDGLGMDVTSELRCAGSKIDSIDRIHRCRMLFYVVSRSGSQCRHCGCRNTELTIRPLRASGGFIRSNMVPICVDCLDPIQMELPRMKSA